MTAPRPIRPVGGTGSPYTQKMVALLRYRRVSYALTSGDPGQVVGRIDEVKSGADFVQDTVNGFYDAVRALTARYSQ